VALYAFQRLLTLYVDAAAPATEALPGAAGSKDSGRLKRGFQQLIAVGIKQYVVLVFGCNALLVVVKAWDRLYPSSCEAALADVARAWFPRHEISLRLSEAALDLSQHTRSSSMACEDVWNSVSLLLVVADFFTCSIALFAIFQYEHAFSELLRPSRPFWKLWGVKGLLSVNFLQTVVLAAVGLLAGARSTKYFRSFLGFYLTCIEAFLLAALNIFAYPPPAQYRWNPAAQDMEEESSGKEPGEEAPPARGPSVSVLGRQQP